MKKKINLLPGKIYWLINPSKSLCCTIGFLREKHRNGFLIIGGPTGSYFGGHGDSWKSKINELLSEGYLFEQEAKKKKNIAQSWKPPRLSTEDKGLIKLNAGCSLKGHPKPT